MALVDFCKSGGIKSKHKMYGSVLVPFLIISQSNLAINCFSIGAWNIFKTIVFFNISNSFKKLKKKHAFIVNRTEE